MQHVYRTMRWVFFMTVVLVTGMFLIGGLAGSSCQAQLDAGPQTEEEDEKKKEVYVDKFLTAKDGLQLKIRFYAGAAEKTTVPIILVHRFDGQGSELFSLANHLQSEPGGGHAVIVPDLRGHGQSDEITPPGAVKPRKLNPTRFHKAELARIVTADLEAVKKFLMERNNEGELNIEMLTVVAVEEGAVLAVNWIAQDWSWPQLGGFKQGQDVKAFVLISPDQTLKGISIHDALAHPFVRSSLSALFMYGSKNARSAGITRRMYNTIKRYHRDRFDTDEEKRRHKDLFLRSYDTSLQGTKLLNQTDLKAAADISTFVRLRLTEHQEEYPWAVRKSPAAN